MGVVVQASAEGVIAIHPANLDAVQAFLECSTCWRVVAGPAGTIYLGLDYPSCKLVMEDLGSPRKVFADLRHMERAAMPILNSRDE